MRLLLLLVALLPLPVGAQIASVVVETAMEDGTNVDDALAIGPDGELYGSMWGPVVGTDNQTVSRLDLNRLDSITYVSGLVNANGLDFDSKGDLYVASWGDRRIVRRTAGGAQSTFATTPTGNLSGLFIHPTSGVIYVTNSTNNTVEILEPTGVLTPFLGRDHPELNVPVGLAADDSGVLYVANFGDGKILRVSETGDLTEIADLDAPVGFIAYADGSLFATIIRGHIIQEVSLTDGTVTTIAGTGAPGVVDGPGETAQFDGPNGITASVTGDTLYVSELNSRAVRRIILSQVTTTEAEAVPMVTSRLLPVLPNPFSRTTSVRFRVSGPQHLIITIHDALGRRVSMLTDRVWSAGDHAIPFDSGALASGTYVVRLQAAEGSDQQMMSLTR